MEYTETLDHALKVLYFDQLRQYEIMCRKPWHKRTISWFLSLITSSAKCGLFLLNFATASRVRPDYRGYEWILVNDHSGHCDDFTCGFIKKFSTSGLILYVSNNEKLNTNNSNVNRQVNKLNNYSLLSLWHALSYSWSRRQDFSCYGFWALPIFVKYLTETARIVQACKFYSYLKLSVGTNLVTLCDTHWHQSVLTNEFQQRGLKTFTMIHGQPSEWHLLCPFISKYVLTWGNRMSEMVLKYSDNVTSDKIIQIGNTKYYDPLESYQIANYSYDQLNEVVFISPGYDCFDEYGYRSLKNEILRFIKLNLPGFRLSIRPRPFNGEELFIKSIVSDEGLSDEVSILGDGEFSTLVNTQRVFIGSISSAIADVFILNGLFIGVFDEFEEKILETQMTYSPDIYISMKELEIFVAGLKDGENFDNYLNKLSKIRDNLVVNVPNDLDLFLHNNSTSE